MARPVSGSVSCVTLCEDSSMMAVGFSNSTVRVWSLIPQKLRAMKSADDLADIDKDAGMYAPPYCCIVYYAPPYCVLYIAVVVNGPHTSFKRS